MTLMEILFVVGLFTILLGLTVGAYRKLTTTHDLPAAESGIRSLLYRARNQAREDGFPVEVELDPLEGEARARIRSWVGIWRFEMGDLDAATNRGEFERQFDINGAFGTYGQVKDGFLDEGVVGDGLGFEDGGYMDGGNPTTFNPTEGVELEAWIRPGITASWAEVEQDRDGAMVRPVEEYMIICKGRLSALRPDDFSYFLRMTNEYALEAGIRGPLGSNADDGVYIVSTHPGAVEAERWSKVGMIYDGEGVKILVNDVERTVVVPVVGGEPLECPPRLVPNLGPLYVSHPERSFVGAVDEVRIGAIHTPQDARYRLPQEVTFLFPADPVHPDRIRRIVFAGDGRLDPVVHPLPVQIRLTDAEGYQRSDRLVREIQDREGKKRQDEKTVTPGETPRIPEDRIATIAIERSGHIH